MDAEQSIAEIERLERIFAVPDSRPLSASDLAAANRRHDECSRIARGVAFGSGMGFAAAGEARLAAYRLTFTTGSSRNQSVTFWRAQCRRAHFFSASSLGFTA